METLWYEHEPTWYGFVKEILTFTYTICCCNCREKNSNILQIFYKIVYAMQVVLFEMKTQHAMLVQKVSETERT